MQIEHIIFLIHPYVYESIVPEKVWENNFTQFAEREREVKGKWPKATASADSGSLLLNRGASQSKFPSFEPRSVKKAIPYQ